MSRVALCRGNEPLAGVSACLLRRRRRKAKTPVMRHKTRHARRCPRMPRCRAGSVFEMRATRRASVRLPAVQFCHQCVQWLSCRFVVAARYVLMPALSGLLALPVACLIFATPAASRRRAARLLHARRSSPPLSRRRHSPRPPAACRSFIQRRTPDAYRCPTPEFMMLRLFDYTDVSPSCRFFFVAFFCAAPARVLLRFSRVRCCAACFVRLSLLLRDRRYFDDTRPLPVACFTTPDDFLLLPTSESSRSFRLMPPPSFFLFLLHRSYFIAPLPPTRQAAAFMPIDLRLPPAITVCSFPSSVSSFFSCLRLRAHMLAAVIDAGLFSRCRRYPFHISARRFFFRRRR